MRLLVESRDSGELDRLKAKLDKKGIPVFISAEHSFGKGIQAVPGLWVCLNEQFNDAEAVLNNENHEVEAPVNVEEFYRLLKREQREPIKAMVIDVNKILNVVFGALALALLIIILMKVI